LQTVAFFLLLACVVARPFMAEMTYEPSSSVKGLFAAEMKADQRQPDRTDLSRSVFAMLTLLSAGLWALGAGLEAVRHRSTGVPPVSRMGVSPMQDQSVSDISPVRQDGHGRDARGTHGQDARATGGARWLGVLLAAFVVLSAFSVAVASNKRLAMTGWLEQSTLLLAGFLAMQLCRVRWRFVVVLVVLAALAFTMSAKGLWEFFVEAPIKVAQWEENSAEILRRLDVPPDSPQAIAVKSRATESTPAGFIVMANVFASLLGVLLLAVVGLAAAKFLQARRALPAFLATRKRGELPVGVVVASAVAVLAVPLAAVLTLTRSRGGIVSTVLALAAFAVIFRYRNALAARWKKAVLAAGVVFLALLAAVVAFGLTYDRLPTKTMEFRWLYWTASARMIAETPLTGVGAGNFGAAYLTVRDVRGEEAVKNPHNVIVHALAEFGVPAGVAFLGILGVMLVRSARPARGGMGIPATTKRSGDGLSASGIGDDLSSSTRLLYGAHNAGETPASRCPPVLAWLLVATVPAVGLARAYFSFSSGLGDAVAWVVVFALGVVLAFFALRSLAEPDADLSPVRIALGVAGAAFVLHDLINFAFFQPATAAVFWLMLGASASRVGPRGVLRLAGVPPASGGLASSNDHAQGTHNVGETPASRATALRALSVLFLAAAVAVGVVQVLPVARRTAATVDMLHALYDRDVQRALAAAERAAEADAWDPVAAADAARLVVHTAAGPDAARRARAFVDQAVARDPRHAKYYLLRAGVLGEDPAALADWQRAVELDPQNMRARIDFALRLSWADPAELTRALEQLEQADRVDAGLFAESNERLNKPDRARLTALLTAARGAILGVEHHAAQAVNVVAEALKPIAPRQSEQLRALAKTMGT